MIWFKLRALGVLAVTVGVVSGCGGSGKKGPSSPIRTECEEYRDRLGSAIAGLSDIEAPPEPDPGMGEVELWTIRVDTMRKATDHLRPVATRVVAITATAGLAKVHGEVKSVFERYVLAMETLTKEFENKLEAVKSGREYTEDESARGQAATKAFETTSGEVNQALAEVDKRCPPGR